MVRPVNDDGALDGEERDDRSAVDGARSVDDFLDTVLAVAVCGLTPVTGATVSLVTGDERRYGTVTAGPLDIKAADELQYDGAGGPGVEAMERGVEVRAEIPARQWDRFSRAAEQASVRAVWSLPLQVGGATAGALSLYSTDGPPWADPTSDTARLLARQLALLLDHAAALAQSEHLNATLRRALETRTVIGQAQGILMARQGTTPDEAFDVLRRASQRTNRKLREVAAEIVDGVRHNQD